MKYIIANWKMNLGIRESVALARGTLLALQGKNEVPEVIVCPSFTALAEVRKTLSRTRMHLGAQNVGPGRAGAFTGEVGTAQLEDAGCTHVLIGHSERRITLAEPESVIKEKMQAVFDSSTLVPILCVGEPKEVRKAGKAIAYVTEQIKQAFANLRLTKHRQFLLAYEPVWAIGTGDVAAPADILPMHEAIKKAASQLSGYNEDKIPVLYGGSVTPETAYGLLREPLIDGLLVGGASLKLAEIKAIIDTACEVINPQDSVWH